VIESGGCGNADSPFRQLFAGFGIKNRVIAGKDGAARSGRLFIYNIKYRGL